MKIAIVGAGVIGLSTARSLLARGKSNITVFDRQPGPGLETSLANGALLHPSLVEPWNSPGILSYVLRNLGNDEAAVLLRMRALPSLLGWGVRFVRESSPDRFLANTMANVALAQHSMACMSEIASDGIAYDHYARGTLVIHRDAAALRRAQEWSSTLESSGLRPRFLDVASLIELEPQLAPIADELVGAVHNIDDEAGDSHRYCVQLEARLAAQGVRFVYGQSVSSIEVDAGSVRGLRHPGFVGERFDAVVLSAGAHSTDLARTCGLELPVRPAKGYSITFDLEGVEAPPTVPIVDSELHLAVIPVGKGALRVAGTAEFCGYDVSIERGRIANLERNFARVYPELASRQPQLASKKWAGLRPMCSDGKPLIGATRIAGLYLNTGHGHMGWTLAAGSGSVLGALMTGQRPEIASDPFSPQRFGL
jgi:D-amino-acid dehydrogenase